MEDWQRNIIQIAWEKLAVKTQLDSIFIDKLFAYGVLTENDTKTIDEATIDKMKTFFDILETKHSGFNYLLMALEATNQTEALYCLNDEVNILLKKMVDNCLTTYELKVKENPFPSGKKCYKYLENAYAETENIIDLQLKLYSKNQNSLRKYKDYFRLRASKLYTQVKVNVDSKDPQTARNFNSRIMKCINFYKLDLPKYLECFEDDYEKALQSSQNILKRYADNIIKEERIQDAYEINFFITNLQDLAYEIFTIEYHDVQQRRVKVLLNGRNKIDFGSHFSSQIETPSTKTNKKLGYDNKPSEVAMGIDLGTTSCVVAAFFNGEVKVIKNKTNQTKIPSYISFFSPDNVCYGKDAENRSCEDPENTLYNIKRMIGKTYNDKHLADITKHLPFKVVNNDNEPMIEIFGHQYSAYSISAKLLTYLKNMAEENLAVKPITRAVITVPAYFSHAQRTATLLAGNEAGLQILAMINEPTAAAVAYMKDRALVTQMILVFDLGGGTFDVSLAEILPGEFNIVAVDGDAHLGGDDFDNALMDYCIEQFVKDKNINLGISDRNNSQTAYLKSLQTLRKACEKAKRLLDDDTEVNVTVENIIYEKTLNVLVSRNKFEELVYDYLEKIKFLLKRLLSAATLEPKSIGNVVLVGGCTRMPKILDILKEMFRKSKIDHVVNPDEAVAVGAAIHAHMLNKENKSDLCFKKFSFKDVTSMSIGIKSTNEEGKRVFARIIPKSTKIPTEKMETFVTRIDNQRRAKIMVYQGEYEDVEKNCFIDFLTLTGIPPALKGFETIEVQMKIDNNGILSVQATSCHSGVYVSKKYDQGGNGYAVQNIQLRQTKTVKEKAKDNLLIMLEHSFKSQPKSEPSNDGITLQDNNFDDSSDDEDAQLMKNESKVIVWRQNSVDETDFGTTSYDQPKIQSKDSDGLERLNSLIEFQSHIMRLQVLEETFGIQISQILEKLKKKKVVLFKHNKFKFPNNYVHRRVLQLDRISSNVFLCNTDVFVIENISKKILSTIVPADEPLDTSKNQKRYINLTVRYIILDSPNDFEQLCRKTNLPVHWFIRKSQSFNWKRSRGSIKNIVPYVKHDNQGVPNAPGTTHCKAHSLVNLAPHILLVGLNGDGKSTELKKLYSELIDSTNDKVVLYLDASDIVKKHNTKSKLKRTVVVDYFINTFGKSEAEKVILEKCLILNNRIYLEVFVDVFEIGWSKIVILLEIIRLINTNMNSVRLWIACVQDIALLIQNVLGVCQIYIQPFSVQKKFEYINKILSAKTKIPSKFVEKFTTNLKCNIKNVNIFNSATIGDPVFCYLWACYLLQNLEKSFLKDQPNLIDVDSLMNINLNDLYEKTIKDEFEDYIQDDSNDILCTSFKQSMNVLNYAQSNLPKIKERIVTLHNFHNSFTQYVLSIQILFFLKEDVSCFRKQVWLKSLKAIVLNDELNLFKHIELNTALCYFKYPLVSEFLNRQLDENICQQNLHTENLFDGHAKLQELLVCCAHKNYFSLFQAGFKVLHSNSSQYFTNYYFYLNPNISSEITNFLLIQLLDCVTNKDLYYECVKFMKFVLERQDPEFQDVFITFCKRLKVSELELENFKRLLLKNFETDSRPILKKIIYYFTCFKFTNFFENLLTAKFDLHSNNRNALLLQLENFIKQEHNLFQTDLVGNTFLHYITQQNITSSDFDDLINSVKSDILEKLVNVRGNNEQTILHMAVSYLDVSRQTMKTLDEAKMDFTSTDVYQESVLHTAIRCNRHKNTIISLIECGADINVLDVKNKGIHYFATKHGNLDAIDVISKKLDINERDNYGNTIGHYVVTKPYAIRSLEKLISCGLEITKRNFKFETPLHIAVKTPHNMEVLNLMVNSESVNAKNWCFQTPLHYAVMHRSNDTTEYYKNVVEFLIDKGANVNSWDIFLQTPLYMALKSNVKLLNVKLLMLFKTKDAISSHSIATKVLLRLVTTSCLSDPVVRIIMKQCREKGANFYVKDEYNNSLQQISNCRQCPEWAEVFGDKIIDSYQDCSRQVYTICEVCTH